MELQFTGNTAMITGSGRGIGKQIAIEFARVGANVVVTSRTTTELNNTAQEIQDEPGDCHPVTADLTQQSDIDMLLEETVDTFGVPDILVNNAGVLYTYDPSDSTGIRDYLEKMDTMWQINLRSIFALSQTYAQLVHESSMDSGRIINISSILGHVGVRGRGVYSGTKAGIHGITRSLAVELADYGITVNSISPGLVGVDRILSILDEEPERFNVDNIPVGRLGRPADIAHACLFFASDEAEYITGQDLLVDGGASVTSSLYSN